MNDMTDDCAAHQEGLRVRPGRALVPRLRRLRRPGADPEAAADAGHAARELRLHLRHRLLQPLSVLHEDLRHAQHPRSRAGDRHRPQADAAGPVGVGGHRRRRRAGHRRQPLHPRHAAQHRAQDHPAQQPHLRPDQGPVLADLGIRQEDQDHAARAASIGPSVRWPWRWAPAPRSSRARSTATCKHLGRCWSAPPRTRAPPSSRCCRTASCSTTMPTSALTTRRPGPMRASCSSTASR